MYCYLLLVQKEMHHSAVCWLPDSDENVLIQRQREKNERGVDLNTVYILCIYDLNTYIYIYEITSEWNYFLVFDRFADVYSEF